jgi:nucleoside phosphorylase
VALGDVVVATQVVHQYPFADVTELGSRFKMYGMPMSPQADINRAVMHMPKRDPEQPPLRVHHGSVVSSDTILRGWSYQEAMLSKFRKILAVQTGASGAAEAALAAYEDGVPFIAVCGISDSMSESKEDRVRSAARGAAAVAVALMEQMGASPQR